MGQGKSNKEGRMKKSFFFVSIIILGANILFASNAQLAQLASKHVKLSQKIVQEYKHKNSASAMALIKELESGQKTLKSKVRNREISNLLKYLNLCVSDMKRVIREPYSSKNRGIVRDLSDSLREGNRYIARAL
jgi:hypothetical protein